ncbi:MAG: M1 family metallopeptidase [Balneolaceae bacterium]
MHKLLLSTFVLIIFSGWSIDLRAQNSLTYESGGTLTPELTAYNVHYYDLNLVLNPSDSTVSGSVDVHFLVVQPSNRIELALDPGLAILSVLMLSDEDKMISGSGPGDVNKKSLSIQRSDTTRQFYVHFKETLQPGEKVALRISYEGKLRVAPRAPWDGGLVWERTPSGDPWVGVAVQTTGAWLWWPNKDHPSDRPDSVAINLTMPDDLVVASNGRLRNSSIPEEGWKTWHWFVSTPISNYNVTVNAAPYEILSETYTSITGDEFEITFWVLPEFLEQGKVLFPQLAEQIRFMEQIAGPYPFRADKYGLAHAPYLGMEHQSINAYGANFQNNNLFGVEIGYDDLHQHELAHEWWGNMVTAYDWRDFWLHEGFGTYMQALYAEHLGGIEAYQRLINVFRQRMSVNTTMEVAPRKTMSSLEITQGKRGGDVYYKGAMFLHTLRFVIGDKHFFKAIRRFAYPDPDLENVSDGSHMRFATTDDFLHLTEEITGMDLEWLFEIYLRQPHLPVLRTKRSNGTLTLTWDLPDGTHFPMPIVLEIEGERVTLLPNDQGKILIELNDDIKVLIDPDQWILRDHSESRND